MNDRIITVTITSGDSSRPEESLAARTRRVLEPALAAARRSDANLVAVDVETDAWKWEWDGTGLSASRIVREHHDLVAKILSATVPVAVRLDGAVSGLGLALALACDLRFATPRARFLVGPAGSPAAVLSGLPWLLRDRLGSSRAMELMLTGRELDADQSRAAGLVCDQSYDDVVRALGSASSAVTSALSRSLSGPTVAAYLEHLSYESWLGAMASAEASHA